MNSFNWTCPFCKSKTTITISNYSKGIHFYNSKSTEGHIALVTEIIVCPNPECKEYSISARLHKAFSSQMSRDIIDDESILSEWKIRPTSFSKPLPEYIPTPIKDDYYEACAILDLSPKASATLSRRCLQGMIRDFWGISKNRLIDEITELKSFVNTTTWEAIDAVRSIGNIGAHMEKDINIILDIDSGEAQILLKMIEDLIEDWYVSRHDRATRLDALKELQGKFTQKKIG